MQKLKCESCGGNIEIDENNEYATCPFCNTKYKLNETKNVYIKLDENTQQLLKNGMQHVGKFSKMALIPFVLAFIVIVIIVIVILYNVLSFNKSNRFLDNDIETTSNYFDDFMNNVNRSSFNAAFENYSGTKKKFFIESLLDNVVTNNKTNKTLLVSVIYKDKNTSDSDEIIKIKHSLKDSTEYEIKLDYDDNGYVNKVIIEEI